MTELIFRPDIPTKLQRLHFAFTTNPRPSTDLWRKSFHLACRKAIEDMDRRHRQARPEYGLKWHNSPRPHVPRTNDAKVADQTDSPDSYVYKVPTLDTTDDWDWEFSLVFAMKTPDIQYLVPTGTDSDVFAARGVEEYIRKVEREQARWRPTKT